VLATIVCVCLYSVCKMAVPQGQTDEDELGMSYDFVELYTEYLGLDEAGQTAMKVHYHVCVCKQSMFLFNLSSIAEPQVECTAECITCRLDSHRRDLPTLRRRELQLTR
jgi:hypothetical protein